MKYLVTVILCVLSVTVFSQPIVQRATAGNTVQDARFYTQYNLRVPVFNDTASANTQKGLDSSGTIIYTYDIQGFWVRQTSPKKWNKVTPSGAGTGTVTSVGLTMPSVFTVSNSPVTTSGTIGVTANGTTAQYIRGNGTLQTFPTFISPATLHDSLVNYVTNIYRSNDTVYLVRNGVSYFAYIDSTGGSGNGWLLTGNTISDGDVLGTLNDKDLVFVRNNIQSGRIGIPANGNTSFGVSSLISLVGGDGSTAIGYESLTSMVDGSNNTAVGHSSLNEIIDGAKNTAIGILAKTNSSGSINRTAIGANSYVEQDNSLVLGSINGINGASASTNVGIGTTIPDSSLHVTRGLKFTGLYSSNNASDSMLVIKSNGGVGYRRIPTGSTGTVTSVATGYGLSGGIITTSGTLLVDTATLSTKYTAIGSDASFRSVNITGTNGNGYLQLRHQASDATSAGQHTTLFANSSGYLKYKNDNLYYSTFATPQSADRVFTFQNKSYTLADSAEVVNKTDTVGNFGYTTLNQLNRSKDSLLSIINTKGTGTVTSVATGLGLSGGTITTTGTIALDTANASVISRQRAAATYATIASVGAKQDTATAWQTSGNYNSGLRYLGSRTRQGVGLITSDSVRVYLDSLGRVGIGNTPQTTSQRLYVEGTPTTYLQGVAKFRSNFSASSTNPAYSVLIGGQNTANNTLLLGVDGFGNALIAGNNTSFFRLGRDNGSGTFTPIIDIQSGGAIINNSAGNNITSSAVFEIVSTTKGLLIPVQTQTQVNAVSSPANGLQVYNTDSNKVQIYGNGRWNYIPKGLIATATLDFGSTSAQSSADLTITVTGALDGDMVTLGVPNGSTLTNSAYTAWVSAANTVTVRFSNYSSGSQDPASGTFKVMVIK